MAQAGKFCGYAVWGCVLSSMVLLGSLKELRAATALEYQDRGDRHEGIKPQPVSGYDIELISAIVDFREPTSSPPPLARVKFFLTEPSEVNLTVRELEVEHYYWLDRAVPRQPWAPGFANEFSWPTAPVLRSIDPSIDLYRLAVVVRLGKRMPSAEEFVAPALWYHSTPASTVKGYLFTFKTAVDAKLSWAVYREPETVAVEPEATMRSHGGRPFVVRWSTGEAVDGPYRLVVRGYTLDRDQPFQQVIRFAHHRAVD